jgi:Lipopolysaccharide kinase (Kdo/WaaP) family
VSDLSDNIFRVDPAYQPLFREIGLDAESVFVDPRIKVWRSLPDRDNCTLDATLTDGRAVRLHIKRYPSPGPAENEVAGHQLLEEQQIPAAQIVAHGRLSNGRSFVILPDLSGYTPADKLVQQGIPFESLLIPTADLAALLHMRGLHHRDLYLCHFMAKIDGDKVDVKLIDTARVRKFNVLTRHRWIVKDLAQFWFSTLALPITEDQRRRWLDRYAKQRQLFPTKYRNDIERKVRSIARHDARLNLAQPSRNISLPFPPLS